MRRADSTGTVTQLILVPFRATIAKSGGCSMHCRWFQEAPKRMQSSRGKGTCIQFGGNTGPHRPHACIEAGRAAETLGSIARELERLTIETQQTMTL